MKKTTPAARPSLPGSPNLTILIVLVLLSMAAQVNSNNLRVYPLADDYFEKIYMLTLNKQ
jgi:hypothetical protein